MGPPRWDDPIGSACEEAAVAVRRGLQVRPTLYAFEDGEPTLRVQPGLPFLQRRQDEVHSLLVGLVPILGLRQLLLFSSARTTDPDIDDPDLQAALASYGITVEVAARDGDEVTVAAHLVDHHVEDGALRWHEPVPLETGFWSATLRHALREEVADPAGNIEPMGAAYAFSRWGVIVEVAPGWRDRYGFSRLPARADRLVRPVDRRRVRELARARRPVAPSDREVRR